LLASRATFQNFLGEADQRLKAARALMIADGVELMKQAEHRTTNLRAVEAGTRAAGAFAVRTASDVLADTVRFAGGSALRQGSVFEQAVRDLTVAASHLLVNESAYENHAQFLLGLAGADPMA
jgi:alkylation response protein AidB-like acyl-CoA dehydrogenase